MWNKIEHVADLRYKHRNCTEMIVVIIVLACNMWCVIFVTAIIGPVTDESEVYRN